MSLKPGQLERFVASLTPAQLKTWAPISAAWEEERRAAANRTDNRDKLFSAFEELKAKIRPEDLETMVKKAVEKGDAQMLRVLAQMSGVDLSEKVVQASGEGAKLIILRPYEPKKPKEIAGGDTDHV